MYLKTIFLFDRYTELCYNYTQEKTKTREADNMEPIILAVALIAVLLGIINLVILHYDFAQWLE